MQLPTKSEPRPEVEAVIESHIDKMSAEIGRVREILTETVSTLTRQLAFAGIAVVWLFKVQDGSHYYLPAPVLSAALFLVLALAVDFIGHLLQAAAADWFEDHHERLFREGVNAGRWPWYYSLLDHADPFDILFLLASAATLTGYGYLLVHLYRVLDLG